MPWKTEAVTTMDSFPHLCAVGNCCQENTKREGTETQELVHYGCHTGRSYGILALCVCTP